MQVGAAEPATRHAYDHVSGAGRRVGHGVDGDRSRFEDHGCFHFTAPRVSPRTSLSWASHPAMSTGSDTSVAAAQSRARNSHSTEKKTTRKTGAVDERVVVCFTA